MKMLSSQPFETDLTMHTSYVNVTFSIKGQKLKLCHFFYTDIWAINGARVPVHFPILSHWFNEVNKPQ